MKRYHEYKNLLSKTYDEAVEYVLQKYGFAQDDFFREKSYHRFLNGEIKNITKGKYSRTDEGLYCHHIDEIRELNISDQNFVKSNKIPFEYQKKDRLVYCDLIEHTILHVLITKETSHEFGLQGYTLFLKPLIEEWYIEERLPSPKWMMNCYHKSFLEPKEAVHILREMQATLGMSYFSTPHEFYREKQRRIEELKKKIRRREEEEKEWREKEKERKEKEKEKEREKQILKERTEGFHQKYPEFKEMNICFDIPRQKVIAMMYDYKYNNLYKSKKELDVAMKPLIKDELLQELYLMVCEKKNGK